jgi:DNA-binding transcriptional regulator GbsR (MarR family)
MTTMDDGLVQDVSQILLLLLSGKAHVNYIIKETGISKNRVFVANNFLEKAELANRIKDKQVHKQKEYLQLNEFGQEVANFIKHTSRFEKLFEGLKETIKHFYYMPEANKKKAIRSSLLNRGLNQQEIDSYRDDLDYAENFVSDSLLALLDGIVNKYALFLLEFSPNDHAKEFLKEVIIRRLSNYLLLKVETIVKEVHLVCECGCGKDLSKQATTRYRINEMVEENGSRLFNSLKDWAFPFNNKHIEDEVKGVISCLFSIFHLPKKYVEQEVKENIEQIEEIESHPSSKVSSRLHLDETQVKRNLATEKSIYNYVAELNASA